MLKHIGGAPCASRGGSLATHDRAHPGPPLISDMERMKAFARECKRSAVRSRSLTSGPASAPSNTLKHLPFRYPKIDGDFSPRAPETSAEGCARGQADSSRGRQRHGRKVIRGVHRRTLRPHCCCEAYSVDYAQDLRGRTPPSSVARHRLSSIRIRSERGLSRLRELPAHRRVPGAVAEQAAGAIVSLADGVIVIRAGGRRRLSALSITFATRSGPRAEQAHGAVVGALGDRADGRVEARVDPRHRVRAASRSRPCSRRPPRRTPS